MYVYLVQTRVCVFRYIYSIYVRIIHVHLVQTYVCVFRYICYLYTHNIYIYLYLSLQKKNRCRRTRGNVRASTIRRERLHLSLSVAVAIITPSRGRAHQRIRSSTPNGHYYISCAFELQETNYILFSFLYQSNEQRKSRRNTL